MFQEIHIENTNSCGYKCAMCPRDKHTRQIGFMSLEDFSFLLDRLGSHAGFFHLHGFGEPLLDRKLIEKIQVLKTKLPSAKSLIYSTLGTRVKEDYFLRLLGAGLTHIVVSFYGFTQQDYQQIHGFDGFELAKRNLKLLAEAMKLSSTFVSARIKIPGPAIFSSLPINQPPELLEFCSWAEELGFSINKWSYVHNYSDGRSYNEPSAEKLCPVIAGKRKGILNITWDLNVIPCCYDYNATIRFGNLREQTVEEIFSSPEYLAFVLAQTSNHLDAYPICQNCEKHDYN